MPSTRLHHPVSALHAVQTSPHLAQLAQRAGESGARLAAVRPLIPAALHASVQAGPIDGSTWCLLVKGNGAAAKIRQLLPALTAHLRTKGWDVAEIRLRVLREVSTR